MNETNINKDSLSNNADNDLEEIIRYFYMIIYPLIFIFGLIGNLLLSLFFSITELSQSSCCVYFLLRSLFNSIALLGGLHHCLIIGFGVQIVSGTYCRARNFLLYTSMDMSSWMVAAISVDRFLRVKYPFQSRIYSTRKITIIASCILMIVFIIKNIHLSTRLIGDFTTETVDYCVPNPNYPKYVFFFENIWPWIDLTTFVLLPFILISYCNVFIIYDQCKRHTKLGKRTLDRSLIKFLLISSILFCVCNFPMSITLVIYPYVSQMFGKQQTYDTVAFAFDILRLPSYGSFAFNFYLYYYTSSAFRQQTLNFAKRLFRIKPNETPLAMIER